MICKKCGKEFHYCSNCISNIYQEYGYCSKECFEDSEELKENKTCLLSFLYSLDRFQYKLFKTIFYNVPLDEYPYEGFVENFIDQKDKKINS